MTDRDDLLFLSKYPFLPAARTHVASLGFKLADLLEDPAFETGRRRGLSRVKEALGSGQIPEVPLDGTTSSEVELLSYPLARAIVAQLNDDFLTNRYAVAEAKLLNRRLTNELSEGVRTVALALGLPLASTNAGSFASIPFLDYLRHAPTRDPDWKLVNQRLDHGQVILTRTKTIRLAEEALRTRLANEVGDLERPGAAVTRAFGPALNEITLRIAEHRARFKQEETGELVPEAFPPCMQRLWKGIAGSVNVPHMGRFAIVAFLHKLGMNSDAILKFFATVPDFDVSKSRYQIEHITGTIGGGTEYTPPNCQTMATYGICPLEERDELCFKITHPLTYYRKRAWQVRRAKPAAPPAPAAPKKEAARA